MRSVVTDHWPDHDDLMEANLFPTMFSFGWNKRVFRPRQPGQFRPGLAPAGCGCGTCSAATRCRLGLMPGYHDECLARMRSVLTARGELGRSWRRILSDRCRWRG